ncbi:MAG: hypothetical protein CMD83_16005 [Gammaproteobacteria bacterium]|nr:hypothetical protein [Gammaproteobacteria bacterium]
MGDQPGPGDSFRTGVIQDISDQKERKRVMARAQDAQKLESLGLLAGGVTHDFNNLLSGILGNADLALIDTSNQGAVEERLADIIQAAKKAADLTRQLLALLGQRPLRHQGDQSIRPRA